MKRHLITFLLLAVVELGLAGAGMFFGHRYRTNSQREQKQTDFMRQAHSIFVADQNALTSQAADGAAYREYKSQWEARMKEYDAPSKVIEVLNAEASRAGISSPRLNDSKGAPNAFDMTCFGRLNELSRWLASAEGRIDLLVVDEVIFSSQIDSTISLTLRAHMAGGFANTPAPAAAPSGNRKATTQKK